MAKPNTIKTAKEKLLEKYGVTGKYAGGKEYKSTPQGKQSNSASPIRNNSALPMQSGAKLGLYSEKSLLEKYGVTGKSAGAKYVESTENAYEGAKKKATTKTTISNNLSDEDRKTRIKEIDKELREISYWNTGMKRGGANYMDKDLYKKLKKEKDDRAAELQAELKSLERTGNFTASELKQFEIDDAKDEKAKLPSYNPTARISSRDPKVIEEYIANAKAHTQLDKKIDTLEREKELYDDINDFSNVTNKDTFTGQWRANYRSNELSREADKAMAEYLKNPTEENKQIAYAYDAFVKEYAKNNKEALDDENVKASWLSKSLAGYLPQLKDQVVPELIGGGIGTLLGSVVGAPSVGASIGAGLGTQSQMYDVMRGSVYRSLLAEGVDEETARQASEDEALISSLIESGGTAVSWALTGGGKALTAIANAARSSMAKGTAGAATRFIANMATKQAAKSASAPAWQTIAKTILGVGGNAVGEYAEEFAQQGVSIANKERALQGETGKGSLISNAGKVIGEAITGKNPEALSEMHEAGKEGFKIGLMMGGTQTVTNNVISKYANAKTVENQNEILDTIINDEETLTALIEEGKASGEKSVSAKIAKEVEKAKANGKVTREQVKRLIASNEVYIKAEEAVAGETDTFEVEDVAGETDTFEAEGIREARQAERKAEIESIKEKLGYGTDTHESVARDVVEENNKKIGETDTFERVANDTDKIITETTEANTLESVARDVVEGKTTKAPEANVFKPATSETSQPFTLERSKAPTTESVSKKSSMPLRERLEYLSRNNEPITEADVKKVTGFDNEGAKVVTKYANQDGATFNRVVTEVKGAYISGRSHPDVPISNMASELTTPAQADAYSAGQIDRRLQDLSAKTQAQKAVINKESGFKAKNLPKDVTKTQVEILNRIDEALGVKSYVTKDLDANAYLDKTMGEIPIDYDFERTIGKSKQEVSIVYHASHEALHRVVELAPEEGNAFVYAMYNHLAGNEPSNLTLADKKRDAYAKKGVEISLAKAMEEVSANHVLYLYGNDEGKFQRAIDNIVNGTDTKAKQGLRKFVDGLKKIIRKLNEFIHGKTASERAQIQAEIDEITRMRDMFETAFKKAVENKKALETKSNSTQNAETQANVADNENVEFSLKNKNLTINSSIPYVVLEDYNNVTKGNYTELNSLVAKVENITKGTYKNKATEYSASITTETIDKAIRPTHKKFNRFNDSYIRNLNAMLRLSELFENAVYVDSKNPQKAKNKNKAIKDYHHFVAPLFMDNVEYRALITAREKIKSNTLYVLKVEVLPTQKRHTPVATQQNNAGGSQLLSVPSDISIAELVNGVKIYNYDTQITDTYTSNDIQFSLKDTDYMKAVESEDMETAQKMVDEVAEKAFSDSKVRGNDGKLLKVYHGTVNDFTVFKREFANIEGDFGKGYYFSSNEYDVDANYANEEGPDLKNKIAHYADKLEWEDEYSDLSYEEREEIARQKFITSEPNTITAYLNMENPVYITPDTKGTFLDFNEAYDEEYDEYGEPEGLFVDFIEALKDNASDYAYNDVNFDFLWDHVYDEGGMYASDAVKIIKNNIVDELSDDNGDLALSEVIRLAFEQIGFDGIIDTSVYYKFRNMDGMDSGTTHYIVFDSEQIKSAEPVTYDDSGNVIPLSERFNTENEDIRYSLKDSEGNTLTEAQQEYFKDSKVRDENGNLKVVYHGTRKADFTVFKRNINFFTDNKEMADSYAPNGEMYEGYLNITNPYEIDAKGEMWSKIPIDEATKQFLEGYGAGVFKEGSKWRTTPADIASAIEEAVEDGEMDYDGIIIKNIDDTGSYYKGKEKNIGTDYIVFGSNPFKSINNANPTSDPDINFSLKGTDLDTKGHKELVDIINHLQGEFEVTKFAKTDPKKLTQMTKSILKEYDSKADFGEVYQDIDDLYTYIANGEGENPAAWNDVYNRAYNISQKIVENALVKDDYMYREYESLRKHLRNTPMKFDAEYDSVPSSYGSFNEFRKANMGRLKFTNDGMSIDAVYQELSSLYPEFFNEEEQSNTADQLEQMLNVLDEIQPTEINPFDSQIEQVSTYLANDLISRFFDLPQAKPTFADKAERRVINERIKGNKKVEAVRLQKDEKIKKILEKQKEKTKKQLDKLRQQRNDKVEKEKQKRRDAVSKMNETQKTKVLRARIMRHTSDLSKKLINPTDNQHIPAELQGAVAKLLECINLESNYTYDMGSHSYKKNDDGLPTRRTQAFNELKKIYADMASSVVVDPDLLGENGWLSDVISLADKRIADMNLSELDTVWQTIRAIEASISTANKIFAEGKFATVLEFAEALRDDNAGKKEKTELKGVLGKGKKLASLDMLTPETYLHYLGDAGDSVFRMMRDAQDKHISIMKEVADFIHKELKGVNVNKLENTIHTVKLGGEDVKLSTAQLMELYVLMNREQAVEHILIGGILPDVTKSKGIKLITKTKPTKNITVGEISTAIATLTDEQKKIADKLQKYVSTTLSAYGNEASMQVYNYEKFLEEKYWTIRTNKQEISTEVGKDTTVTSVANKGMAKGTKPHANTSVRIGSIFDTFSAHASDMATYAAWLGTSEDVNRIRNFVFWEDGARTGTVKSILDTVHGLHGSDYLQKLLTDIAIGVKGTDNMNPFDKLIGNYKAASVGANIRVIIQQPTAILRAMDMIGAHYLAEGAVRPLKGWEKAKKYAPIAQWKDWGHFDINTGRQMKDVLFDNASLLEKTKQVGMWGASLADSLAWGQLWNAVEAETKAKYKDLEVKSEKYYETVAKRFTEIVDHTQVVDGILQRSQIMRSPDSLTKMATSFMGEPTKQYNMMISALNDVTKGKPGTRKKAVGRLGKTAVALAVSGIVNACAQSIIDALRDDDKEKDYWEKWLVAFMGDGEDTKLINSNVGDTFNPLGYVPFAKDIMSIMQGYDVKRMDAETITKTVNAATNMYKAITGNGKYTIAEASAQLFAEIGRLYGLPVANVKRDIKAIATTTAIETDNYLMQYRMEKAMLNINYAGNNKNFMDILFNAYRNDREAYELIYDDMLKSGYDTDKIKNGMETRAKEIAGVKKSTDLPKRYMTPAVEEKYDKSLERIKSTDTWTRATVLQKKDAKAGLYEFLTSDSEDMKKTREEAQSYGVDETEYTLWKLAIEMADQPEGEKGSGSYDYTEKAEAINSLDLGDREIAYFFGKGLNESSKEELEQTLDAGIDIQEYVNFKAATSVMEADKNAKGNSIPNSKKRKVVNYLNNSNLTREEWNYFYYEIMGYKK